MDNDSPRITFGVIVLNGEPFTRYCIRALYPFAHQIIVVEGAAPGAINVATADGHSSDSTLDVLRVFKAREDPDNKMLIVTAEDEGHPNGFWPGEKDEQSQAYARRATGNYLWQVDIDEFYKREDIQAVVRMLQGHADITAVSFKQVTFWGGFDYITDGWYLRRGAETYHRLFKWGPGYKYITHRPPTVHDPSGTDLRTLNWVNGGTLARRGILLYHYSLLFPKHVLDKCAYYQEAAWAKRTRANDWAQASFMALRNPFRVHNVYQFPSWLERFHGIHPDQVLALRRDIISGLIHVDLRQTDDIEGLLHSRRYSVMRTTLRLLDPADRCIGRGRTAVAKAMLPLLTLGARLKHALQRATYPPG